MSNWNLVLVVVLVGLIALAGVEAMQIADLKAEITGSTAGDGIFGQIATKSSDSVQTKSQPVMVGGC